MHASPLRTPANTPALDRLPRPTLVLAAAALLALVVVTPANGDEHDPTNPGRTQQAATDAPLEPCAEGEHPEVLAGTLGAASTAPSGSARLLLPADGTADAVFPCLHPNLNCAL